MDSKKKISQRKEPTMPRKSQYDQQVDEVRARLRSLNYSNAKTVEEAVANEQTVCNVFGMAPSESGTYDYCPDNNRVRRNGQCPECED
jgi:hypothetical protein